MKEKLKQRNVFSNFMYGNVVVANKIQYYPIEYEILSGSEYIWD